MLEDNDYTTDVVCPVCGIEFECHQRDANAEVAPCCCEECERQWKAEAERRWHEGMAEINYRCGYDYACGYHD